MKGTPVLLRNPTSPREWLTALGPEARQGAPPHRSGYASRREPWPSIKADEVPPARGPAPRGRPPQGSRAVSPGPAGTAPRDLLDIPGGPG